MRTQLLLTFSWSLPCFLYGSPSVSVLYCTVSCTPLHPVGVWRSYDMYSCCSGLLSVYYLTVAGIAYSVCIYTGTFNIILHAGLLSVFNMMIGGHSVNAHTVLYTSYPKVAECPHLPWGCWMSQCKCTHCNLCRLAWGRNMRGQSILMLGNTWYCR